MTLPLCIISCPTCTDRLPSLIKSLEPMLKSGLVGPINIIHGNDDSLDHQRYTFESSGWELNISEIESGLRRNLRAVQGDSLSSVSIGDLFPKRELSSSEKSIAIRHYKALEFIGSTEFGGIVIEDDAIYNGADIKWVRDLIYVSKANVYIDLADDYIPISIQYGRDLKSKNFIFGEEVVTRTLLGYALSCNTAKELMTDFWPCSLPVDMHYQYLMSPRLNSFYYIAPVRSPFVHGSKRGAFSSSIRSN